MALCFPEAGTGVLWGSMHGAPLMSSPGSGLSIPSGPLEATHRLERELPLPRGRGHFGLCDCSQCLDPCSGDLRLPHDPRQLKPPLSSPGCCGAAPQGAAGGRGESSAHSSPPVLAPDSTELLHVLSPLWLPSPHGAPRDTFPVNWSRTLVSACSWAGPQQGQAPSGGRC